MIRAVLDTNVIVPALFSSLTPPARVLDLFLNDKVKLLFDERVISEYEEVLKRKKFGFNTVDIDHLIGFLRESGELISANPINIKLPDPDDIKFLEVAISGSADVLITGNKKYFPRKKLPFKILNPAEFLSRMVAM